MVVRGQRIESLVENVRVHFFNVTVYLLRISVNVLKKCWVQDSRCLPSDLEIIKRTYRDTDMI